MNNPKVSIVLPTYNGSKYIRESIDSCLNQTYKNIELIIVDDCSTDETPNIVKTYDDQRITYIRHDTNKRLPDALNSGFSNARGELLTWTSDDNIYLPEAIVKMLKFLDNNGVDFVYADYYAIYDSDLQRKSLRRLPDKPDLENGNCIGYCFLYKRKIWEITGNYDSTVRLAEDYDYWIRISQKFRMARLPEALYLARYHDNSLYSRNYYEVKLIDFLLRVKYRLSTAEASETLVKELILQKKLSKYRLNGIGKRLFCKVNKALIKMIFANKILGILKDYENKEIGFDVAKARLNKIVIG